MNYQFPPDVERLVREQMATKRFASKEDLMREALLALADQDDDLLAVLEAVADIEAGDQGVPLDDAFEAVRRIYATS
jgi:Arc/MetJ-type ribon-helix-helix transcriptional regulator